MQGNNVGDDESEDIMKTTLEMAREAGLHIPYWAEEEDPKKDPPRWTMISSLPPLLEAFEALVRADEREGCAKVCEEVLEQYRGTRMGKHAELVGDNCVAAIRARENT